MSEFSENSISIDADPDSVRKVLFDLAGYPTWSTEIKSVQVIENDDQNRPTKVKIAVDAGVLRDSVILDYDYSQAPAKLSFSLDDADLLTEMSGAYLTAENSEGGTLVTYQMKVGLSMPVPAMMRQKVERATIDLALKQLKNKIEG
ncbi:MAG: SRPBCC family protein [Actinomycetes bacterium]